MPLCDFLIETLKYFFGNVVGLCLPVLLETISNEDGLRVSRQSPAWRSWWSEL